MFRKFIKDSTLFLAQTYKLSGFRFDLMGLHDLETMNQTVKNLQDNYNANIAVWGEPWNLTTSTVERLAIQGNMNLWTGFSGFNDVIRDGVKGSVFDAKSVGWATDKNGKSNASYEKVRDGLLGHTYGSSKDPSKSISYVSCHDNNTLFDKLKLSVTSFDNSKPVVESEIPAAELNTAKSLVSFASSIVYTSQGTSFMNAGDEILRTKLNEDNSLNENSYNATYKCNELDYSRKAANLDTFQDFQNLIKIKNELGAYNYASAAEVTSNTVNLTEVNNKTYIDIETTTESGLKVRAIYVSPQVASIDLDLTGYTHYYSSFDQYSANNLSNVSVLGGTTLIVTKA